MPGLSGGEIARIVNRYIGVSGGYLGDFSYASHSEFYSVYCDLDVDPYEWEGTTRVRFMEILRSLPPVDQAKVVRGVVERFPVDAPDAPATRTDELAVELTQLAARLEGAAVPQPVISATEVVQRALTDAEILLSSQGPVSAMDRVHTAVHGYLIDACDRAGIEYPRDAATTALFKRLRQEHPGLQDLGPRAEDVGRVLNACASILDSLNPIRNRASVAHPNPKLLGEGEARLVMNVANTLLSYLQYRIG